MAASFVCPHCGAESFNPNDIRERYCGRCHQFEDDRLDAMVGSVAIKRLIEEVRLGKEPSPQAYNRIYSRHNR
jgi:hypothetical protein